MNTYKKEELEELIFKKNLSYEEIGKMFGITGAGIKKAAKSLGISLPIRKKFSKDFIPHNKGNRKVLFCINCEKELNSGSKKYCSNKCQGEFKSKKFYKDFLENNNKYCNIAYCLRPLKPYFLLEQNHKCNICGIDNVWNGKELIFVLDHIDGNAANNKRVNLRLICSNCDSQLDTYKSKNKNSARKERYLKQYKN